MAIMNVEAALVVALQSKRERGILFDDSLIYTPEEEVQLRIFGPPLGRFAYWDSPDGEASFAYTTEALDQRWYAPFKWMVWTMVSSDNGTTWETDTDSVRFTDLRREAKEEALARLRAAESEQ